MLRCSKPLLGAMMTISALPYFISLSQFVMKLSLFYGIYLPCVIKIRTPWIIVLGEWYWQWSSFHKKLHLFIYKSNMRQKQMQNNSNNNFIYNIVSLLSCDIIFSWPTHWGHVTAKCVIHLGSIGPGNAWWQPLPDPMLTYHKYSQVLL